MKVIGISSSIRSHFLPNQLIHPYGNLIIAIEVEIIVACSMPNGDFKQHDEFMRRRWSMARCLFRENHASLNTDII